MFRFRLVVLGFTFAALGAACRNAPPPMAQGHDDFGHALAIDHRPERIVSLNPTTTEMLFALGAGSRLVGRSQYDVFPDSARAVPDVGPAMRPNIEAVLAQHPDLVLLYASDDNRAAYDRLTAAKVPAFAFKIDSIEQFARDTRLIGSLLGDSARAEATVDTIEATLRRVRAMTSALPHPTVFIHAWDKPIIAIGGGSFLSELLDIAGAKNIYGDSPLPSLTVSLEDVVRRNPDFMLASPTAAPKIEASATWRAIPAVHNGHVLVYDTTIVGRPSVQLGAAAYSLARLLHPREVK
ncbi:MAG TPA: helical backbone metal receptor [Gemmatimonadaceae bacterium]|nr:helical backbone metal receptor [Gemmatimonadaceae bacterium]